MASFDDIRGANGPKVVGVGVEVCMGGARIHKTKWSQSE